MMQHSKKDKKTLWRRIFLKKKKKKKDEKEGDETNQDDQGGEEQNQAIHKTEYDVQIVQSRSIVSQPTIPQDDFGNNSASERDCQFHKSEEFSQTTGVLERLNQNNESTYKSVNESLGSSEYEYEKHEDDDGYNVGDYSSIMDSLNDHVIHSGDELASSEIEAAFAKGLMSESQYKKILAINETEK